MSEIKTQLLRIPLNMVVSCNYRLGNRDKAQRLRVLYTATVDTMTYRSSLSHLRLAWMAAVSGEKETAVQLLRQAIEGGAAHTPMLPRDMDFEGLWDYGPFQALFSYFPN